MKGINSKFPLLLLLSLFFLLFALPAFAVSAASATAAASGAPGAIGSVFSWLMANSFYLGAIIVAILDLLFAINPGWQSNSILHFLFLTGKKMVAKTPPNAPAAPTDPTAPPSA